MSYQVTIASSGHTFDVEPLETVLDAALRQGIILPYGCRNGNCGNCKGDILSGSVDYEDGLPPALNDEDAAQNRALFCQAHPNCDLTIKVREVDAARDIEVRTLPCRVNKLEHLAHDVIRIYLKIPESQRLQFLAGQYIDVLLKDHAPRAFSIANAPHDDDFIELQIRNVSGGFFSAQLFNQVQEKALLRIKGPLAPARVIHVLAQALAALRRRQVAAVVHAPRLLVDAFLHIHTFDGGAGLPAIGKGAPEGAVGRPGDV